MLSTRSSRYFTGRPETFDSSPAIADTFTAHSFEPKLPPAGCGITSSLLGGTLRGPGEQEQVAREAQGVRVDRQHARRAIEVRDRPDGLERLAARAVPAQAVLHDDAGVGEVAVDLAERERALVGDVRAERVVHERGALLQRLLGVDDGVEQLVLDLDQVGGVLGDVARLSEHGDDALADVPDLVDGEAAPRRLVRRGAEVRHRVGDLGRLRAGDDREHAGQRLRPRRVDRRDLRVGVRAAHERGVEHAAHAHVVDVAALAEQELRVLDAADRLPDPLALAGVDAGRRMLGDGHVRASSPPGTRSGTSGSSVAGRWSSPGGGSWPSAARMRWAASRTESTMKA